MPTFSEIHNQFARFFHKPLSHIEASSPSGPVEDHAWCAEKMSPQSAL